MNELDVLDLLVDGPSSVGALYHSLIRNVDGAAGVTMPEFVAAIQRLHTAAEIRLGRDGGEDPLPLAQGERDALLKRYVEESGSYVAGPTFDPIGLWCDLTAAGRRRWEAAGYDQGLPGSRWVLQEDLESKTVTVSAETRRAGERVLEWWLERNPQCSPHPDINVEYPVDFDLRGGERLSGGVRIRCRFDLD